MIVEKERTEFLKAVLEDNFLRDDKQLAVCLVIPQNELNKQVAADAERDCVIEQGIKILLHVDNGVYARIGWTTYFCVTQEGAEETKETIQTAIKEAALIDKNCALWTAGVAPAGNRPLQKVFEELERRLNKENTSQ
jgi:hypothetical protein